MDYKKLHDNIITQKKKHRYTYNQISDVLGYSNGVFEVKMQKLKHGNMTVISIRDIARLVRLFGCNVQELLNGVVKEK